MTESLAAEIDQRLQALPDERIPSIRRVRREYSRRLRKAPARTVVSLADELVERHRLVAYELLHHHPSAVSRLDLEQVERLGRGIDSWWATDAFSRYISGPAWLHGAIADGAVKRWAESEDRWWRRAALVSTVALNLRTAGGSGDTVRTLAICRSLVADRDDTVVKALSWALRELVRWDPDAVRGFLEAEAGRVAARVRREVTNKLETGRKIPSAR